MDELYTYVKKEDKVRIWTTVDRNRLRFAGFEVGDASSETLRKLWNNVAKTSDVKIVCTDGTPAYKELFEKDISTKHVITKAETAWWNRIIPYSDKRDIILF
jgi:IS1 family transposase